MATELKVSTIFANSARGTSAYGPAIASILPGARNTANSTVASWISTWARNFIFPKCEINSALRPGASEAGFWRIKPNNVLEVVISHNTGITEGWLGHFDGPKIQLAMDQGYSAPSAKIVTAGVRLYGLVEGELFYAYDMAAEGQTLQAHIWSTSPRSTD